MRRRLLALCLLLSGAGPAAVADPGLLRPDRDDIAVERTIVLEKGTWVVPDANGDGVLHVTRDGVILDLGGGALLGAADGTDPDRLRGIGIVVSGARDVTIRNGSIRGFKVGISARNAPGLELRNVDTSENYRQRLGSTPEREDAADWLWPHENDAAEWETRYGAGLSLSDCGGAEIVGCRTARGQNGLLLTRCRDCLVWNNDFSFNSGWGIALYRTSDCKLVRNRCDWCVRGYSHGVYHRGQDSAGILLFEQSTGNLIVGNSATHSGDGLFLYAGHETTKRTGTGGSNRNLVFDNDFSQAVANGIEATFSEGNVFVRNDCSECDHGVWAGYSRGTLIGGNKIERCLTAGVSIEHGQENRIVANRVSGAPVGIHLWWDMDEAFVNGVFGQKGDTKSRRNQIHGNDVVGCKTAIRLAGDTETQIRWNVLHATEVLLDLGPRTRPGLVAQNIWRGRRRPRGELPLLVRDGAGTGWVLPESNERRGHLRGEAGFDPMTLPEAMGMVRPPSRLPDTPDAPGEGTASLPASMPRGREQIRVGEWGPLDPRLPYAFPGRQAVAGPEAAVHLAGAGPFSVEAVEGDVEVSPREGTLPARLTVRARRPEPGAASGRVVPFSLRLSAGGLALPASGVLLDASWHVRWYEWTADPRTDAPAFARLLAAAPKREARTPALDYPWKTGGPEGVAPERFATLATTTLRLAAGRYRIRTVSDDGVRVRVGEKLVIDNWTHHGPTEDVAEIDLPAGEHAVRVEHFEIDGWAHLSFRIEPAGAGR